jgi:hypothetical protein
MTSTHAKRRMQQRGIPPLVMNWLMQFGQMRYDHHGGILYYFDRRSRRQLEREVGSKVVARLSEFLDAYVVSSVCDETIITVGHRCKRFNFRAQ